ncbi:MAG: 50S ribosomal protein L23 [Alphaproteobacteria bacterium]|jgi:large subunit ribosomal protein L23|nr:50S ribosomal protein L23 [Thalassospira sp.]MCE2965104.1 50S ribosomal protein L23 [Alphaproteobacteria bacterium]
MSFKYRAFCSRNHVNDVSKFDVILAPVITEKATLGSQYNQYTFKVRIDATKPAIKQAVEKIFNVKVEGVRTSILPGKKKRFKQTLGQRSDVKKAIVTLAAGQSLDIAAGV